jgi:hypothetical protein
VDADPAPANAILESNDKAAAGGAIPTSLNGSRFNADALVWAWEDPFDMQIDRETVRYAPLSVWM